MTVIVTAARHHILFIYLLQQIT